jgi:Mannosyl-glycoprotein endo-beta-N-acetylglucosaminidase
MTGQGPRILGEPLLSATQMAEWFESTGYHAHLTVPITQLANDYIQAAQQTGVRADIAFAQSIIETGYFTFPAYGQDAPNYNNFAGIGACDTCEHGWKFPNAMTGVLTQQELLALYATPPGMGTTYAGLGGGVDGCCATWMALSGIWASSPAYGYDILTIYQGMLSWALQQELVGTGLVQPPPTPTAGPAALEANRPVRSSLGPSRSPRT